MWPSGSTQSPEPSAERNNLNLARALLVGDCGSVTIVMRVIHSHPGKCATPASAAPPLVIKGAADSRLMTRIQPKIKFFLLKGMNEQGN
jgi:hypothetical protein